MPGFIQSIRFSYFFLVVDIYSFPRQREALASSDYRQQFVRTGVGPNACKPMVVRQCFGIEHYLPAKIRLPRFLDTYPMLMPMLIDESAI